MKQHVEKMRPFGVMIRGKGEHPRELPVESLRALFLEEQLVLLRGFRTFAGAEDFAAYCERFGAISVWPFGKVLELIERENPEDHIFDNNYVPLHWDGMYRPQVPEYQIFHCASAQLSSSTTQQAAALQETVASIDEVSAMVQKNADNAKQSQSSTGDCSNVALKGKEAVEEMIHSMKEIDHSNSDIMQQIEESNRQIGEIVTVINDITNKTKVINDIVFQTKLLSFNASVEAARAGEHGKGFAVVAEEVGNLAQMSGNAAKEISQMLDASADKVQSIVTDTKSKVERLMGSSKEKVEAGAVTARRCGEALDEIVRNVDQVKHMVSEIAIASHEQSQGVTEIGKAMNQLDHVTQSNTAATQESASVAANLKQQSERLAQMVSELTVTVEGAAKAPPTPAPSATIIPMPVAGEQRRAA